MAYLEDTDSINEMPLTKSKAHSRNLEAEKPAQLSKMSKELILLTGASGHLGFRTLVFALKAGYKVRVALRKLEQAEKIKKARSIQPLLEDIEFVEVPDITAPGAYDEAIREVDLVIHVAAPLLAAPDAVCNPLQKVNYISC